MIRQLRGIVLHPCVAALKTAIPGSKRRNAAHHYACACVESDCSSENSSTRTPYTRKAAHHYACACVESDYSSENSCTRIQYTEIGGDHPYQPFSWPVHVPVHVRQMLVHLQWHCRICSPGNDTTRLRLVPPHACVCACSTDSSCWL